MTVATTEIPVYETYNTRYIPPTPPPQGEGPDDFPVAPPRGPGWLNRTLNRVPAQRNVVTVPQRAPGWTGDRQVLLWMWFIAMILVSVDEWHNYGILPRPARLWYTSLTYGLLMVASAADPLVPIANLMGMGFTLVLGYQYFGSAGQFADSGGKPKPPPPAPPLSQQTINQILMRGTGS